MGKSLTPQTFIICLQWNHRHVLLLFLIQLRASCYLKSPLCNNRNTELLTFYSNVSLVFLTSLVFFFFTFLYFSFLIHSFFLPSFSLFSTPISLIFDIGPHCVVQTGSEVMILPPLPSKCWNYIHESLPPGFYANILEYAYFILYVFWGGALILFHILPSIPLFLGLSLLSSSDIRGVSWYLA